MGAKHDIYQQMQMYHSENPSLKAQAIDEIVEDHKKYISRIINKYFATYKREWWEDMFMAGVEGLLECLPDYDPNKGRPTTFFHFSIVHEISTFIANFVQGMSTHYTSKLSKISHAMRVLEKQGNLNPTVMDISVQTGLPAKIVAKTLEIKKSTQAVTYDTESYLDSFTCDFDDPVDAVEDAEQIDILKKAINDLPHEEREVIIRKCGLFGYDQQSNIEISQQTSIPADKIRSYKQSAIRLLREKMLDKLSYRDYLDLGSYDLENEIITLIPQEATLRTMDELVEQDDIEIKGICG